MVAPAATRLSYAGPRAFEDADDPPGCMGTRGALGSTTSRTHTTHSSPYDMDDLVDEEPTDDDARRPKVLPDELPVAMADAYRCVETPRLTAPRSSIRSIHIQIESMHGHSNGGAPQFGGVRRRLDGRVTPPVRRSKKFPWRDGCASLPLRLLLLAVPPTIVLVLLKFSLAYCMLVVLNFVVALAGWEWSWWSFRIRNRLLAPFRLLDDPHVTRDAYEDAQIRALNQEELAISTLSKRCFKTDSHKHLRAFVLASIMSTVIVALVGLFADSIANRDKSRVGLRMLLISAATASMSALFCGLLAATPADSFVVFVYQACFVVSSLNSFLAHHEHLVHDPELLDSMYVLLVGACAIVVWRIVSSKEVLESTVMAMLDVVGLAYLVAPMMAMADILGHPSVQDYDDVVGTFFVVISAAEAAFLVSQCLHETYPRFMQSWRRPVIKNVSTSLSVDSLFLSIVFGTVGSIISVLCFNGYMVHVADGLMYLGAILMSQLCRLALESMKTMARMQSASTVKYQPWIGGLLDLVNPYLLAMIVCHPYVKALIKGS